MKVMVFGTFDDLHPGHEFLLTEASKRGELWIVIARDINVMRIKGRPPLQPEDVRAAVIQKKFPEAHVIFGAIDNYLANIHEHTPDLLLFGYDQQLPPGITEQDLGVPIERLPSFMPEVHKSSLRRATSEKD